MRVVALALLLAPAVSGEGRFGCSMCSVLEPSSTCLDTLDGLVKSMDNAEKLTFEKTLFGTDYSCSVSIPDQMCLGFLDMKLNSLADQERLNMLAGACANGQFSRIEPDERPGTDNSAEVQTGPQGDCPDCDKHLGPASVTAKMSQKSRVSAPSTPSKLSKKTRTPSGSKLGKESRIEPDERPGTDNSAEVQTGPQGDCPDCDKHLGPATAKMGKKSRVTPASQPAGNNPEAYAGAGWSAPTGSKLGKESRIEPDERPGTDNSAEVQTGPQGDCPDCDKHLGPATAKMGKKSRVTPASQPAGNNPEAYAGAGWSAPTGSKLGKESRIEPDERPGTDNSAEVQTGPQGDCPDCDKHLGPAESMDEASLKKLRTSLRGHA